MLHAASRESRDLVTGEVESSAGSMTDRPAVAAALFAVSGLLAGNPGLRRTLAESSNEADDRVGLARRLLEGKVEADALDLVADVVGKRWSSPWDLVDALEGAGNQVLLVQAEQDGHLDDVEDQLFRFGRLVTANDGLRAALDDRAQPAAGRAQLARDLLTGKADPVTVDLVAQGIASTSHASAELAIDDLLELTAERRQLSIGVVTSAVDLSEGQISRLEAALTALYGRPITCRVDVDPGIRGGLVVRVGDEIIDGSVTSRLAAARTALEP